MLTILIRGARSTAKLAEIKPILGEAHQFGTYWRDGDLCVDYLHRDEADLAMNQLKLIAGVHAHIVGDELA